VAKEAQSSVDYGVRERLATRDVSDFNIGHMACVRYAEDLPNGPRVRRINAIAKILRCGPRFTPVQQDWNYVRLIKTQLGIQPDARFPIFSKEVHATPCQSYPTLDLSSVATSGIDRAPKIDEGVDHFNRSICHLDC